MPGFVVRDWQKQPLLAQRVLIVEDELLIALDLQDSVSFSPTHADVIGFANRMPEALRLGAHADIAFVDVNLADGPTGPEIGRRLAADYEVSVIFMTANPESVTNSDPNILGVLTKPVSTQSMEQALAYAVARRTQQLAIVPDAMVAFS